MRGYSRGDGVCLWKAGPFPLHRETLDRAAQALRDGDLPEPVSSCHPRTLRRMRRTNTMIKVLSPQLLAGA